MGEPKVDLRAGLDVLIKHMRTMQTEYTERSVNASWTEGQRARAYGRSLAYGQCASDLEALCEQVDESC